MQKLIFREFSNLYLDFIVGLCFIKIYLELLLIPNLDNFRLLVYFVIYFLDVGSNSLSVEIFFILFMWMASILSYTLLLEFSEY